MNAQKLHKVVVLAFGQWLPLILARPASSLYQLHNAVGTRYPTSLGAPPSSAALLAQLQKHEREQGITPDPELEAIMDADATPQNFM